MMFRQMDGLRTIGIFAGLGCFLMLPASASAQTTAERVFKHAAQAVVTVTAGNSSGTAFLVRDRRTFVTAAHVVDNGETPILQVGRGTFMRARVVAISIALDLAILQTEANASARPLLLGDRDPINPGAQVFAIGTALGALSHTLTDGVFSGRRNASGVEYVQVTSPFSPGMSGGPVLSKDSRVIGVISGSLTEGQNLNIAVAAKHVREMLAAKSPAPIQRPLPRPARTPTPGSASNHPLLTMRGHTDGVWAVTFAPNGQVLASGSDDKTVRLWNTTTGRQLRVLVGHTLGISAVDFAPDGQTLVSGSDDKTVRHWDVGSGRVIRTLHGHTDRVSSVVFSRDGKTIASGSQDATVRLWDAMSGRLVRTLTGHSEGVESVAFSPTDGTLASASIDNTIRLWNTTNGAHIRTLYGHKDRISAIAFAPDGRTLVSVGWDVTIRIWETTTGRLRHTIDGWEAWSYSVAFSPNGKTFASASEDQTIRLWDASSGRLLSTLKVSPAFFAYDVAFSPDGRTLASGGSDDIIRLWRMR